MSSRIRWYGERGVVNALITQIAASGTEAGIAFLKCIQWGVGRPKPWLDQITDIEYIVEIGLARFGDPDLIMVCTTTSASGEKRRCAFFIEAKVTTFQDSYEKGGPSSINRQLTLKYRFATALQHWPADGRAIEESDEQHAAYYPSDEDAPVVENSPIPRHIAKRTVLSICRSAKLHEVEFEDIHFVAWTWDRDSFFAGGWETFLKSPGRPMFLGLNGKEVLGQFAPRVGWLGYQHIHACPVLGELLDDSYGEAFSSMRNTLIPTEAVTTESAWKPLASTNVRKLQCDEVIKQFHSLTEKAKAVFGTENVTVYSGSASVTLLYAGLGYRKVLIKLVPQDHGQDSEKNRLGVSAYLNQSDWAGKTSKEIRGIGTEKAKQPFYMFDLTPDQDGDAFAEAVFDQVAELMLAEEVGQD
ncbi:hypothetical protein OAF34_03315 [Pirellulaceae bacterium]|nr:hypothetical protein [Pirellulaceae bacterium]